MPPLEPPITIVIPGDLHLTEAGRKNHRVALHTVNEVNTLIQPDFVQFIGDNVQDATEAQFILFNDLRARIDVPHFCLVGDHDVKDDPTAEGFRSHVGLLYGSTRLRGFRFLRLDTQEDRPVGLSHTQIDWLRDEFDSALAENDRLVLFQHNYPYQIWEDFAGTGIESWRAIVQTPRVEAIFCGHTHYGQIANDGRSIAVATRSIGDPEGGPPGYTIVHLDGDDLAVTYRVPGTPEPTVLITHPRETILSTSPRHVTHRPDEFQIRVWARFPVQQVTGRIDGGEWFGLECREHDTWFGPLPADELAKGEHAVEVVAIDAEGSQGTHKIQFPVDHTGRFTAVPRAHPPVERTAFC